MRALSRLTLLLLALAAPLIVLAHDFEVDGICYNINPDGTSVTVTYRGENYALNQYSGSVTIPSEVTYNEQTYLVTAIGYEAFRSCGELTSVTIPNSVSTIGSNAFTDCRSLTTVSIPNSVTTIGSGAFSICSGLTYVTIPNSVTTIGSHAFWECYGLTSLDIPNSVITIGDSAFWNCSGLTSVTIPNSVTTIGNSAFWNCVALKSITFGSSLLTIGSDAFEYCSITKAFWMGNTPPKGYTSVKAKVNFVSNDQYKFNSGETLTYPFLSSIFEVNGAIFIPVSPSEHTCDLVDCLYDSELTHLVIPEKVVNRGVELSVLNVGPRAYCNLSEVESVVISKGIRSICNNAFVNCGALADIVIEDSDEVLQLGSNGSKALFADCPLDEVYIGRRLSYQTDADHGYSPFYRNTSLRTVEITDVETQIYDNEFYGCTNLQSLKIGNGVTSIGNWAFSGCSSLNYFSAGYHVETIGQEAFSDCTGLTKYYSYSANPPVCGSQALDDINKWDCQLYVPSASSDEYQAAAQWKDFFFINEMDAVVAAEVRISASEATLKPDETIQLTAEILPLNATDKSVTWSSSDEAVAMVSADGLVTAIAEGRATITVTAASGVSASCVITVDAMNGTAELYSDDCEGFDVYDLRGMAVGRNYTREQLNSLSRGIYIINGRKVRIIGGPAL